MYVKSLTRLLKIQGEHIIVVIDYAFMAKIKKLKTRNT